MFYFFKKISLFFSFFIFFFLPLKAKYIDLGVQGKTYPIAEPDFFQELKQAFKEYQSHTSIEEVKKQLKEKIYQHSIGKTKLGFAKKNKKYVYPNVYELKQDIVNPMGRVIYHKGERIVINNKIPIYLCFLKGNIPELKNEVEFFDKIMKKINKNNECTYLVADISVFKLSKIIPDHDFYPVSPLYEKRFKIKHYPSLVELKGKKITVYEFGIEQFKQAKEEQ